MVPEGVERGGRDGVDGVRPDQLLDVEDVPVVGILGARARPQEPLGHGAAGGEALPAPTPVDLLVALIGEPGVRDGHLPQETPEARLVVRARRRPQTLGDEGADEDVDAADEEAGHARDPTRVAASSREDLEAGQVGLGHLLVRRLGEEEGDVHVDPGADELADRRDPGGRRRDLDHHVLARHRAPEPARFRHRSRRVVGEVGRDLEAHVAIPPPRGGVHDLELVGGFLDVADGQALVQCLGVEVPAVGQLGELGLVVGRAGDGLLEDGGVRRDALEPVLLDQALELSTREEVPPDVVEPDRLAVVLKRGECIRHPGLLGSARADSRVARMLLF